MVVLFILIFRFNHSVIELEFILVSFFYSIKFLLRPKIKIHSLAELYCMRTDYAYLSSFVVHLNAIEI